MNKLFLCFWIACFSCNGQTERYDGSVKKEMVNPQDLGFNTRVLAEMIKNVRAKGLNVNSVHLRKQNQTVLNAHFYPQMESDLHDVASVSKSITSILVGIAIDHGFIQSVDQRVAEFFPEHDHLFDSKQKQKITIAHLLTMTSGLCSSFQEGEALREAMKGADEPLSLALRSVVHEPGIRFTYCSPGVQLLSMIISQTSVMTMAEFAEAYLFEPMGIVSYRFASDANGSTNASGDMFLMSQDLSKIGQLILDKGLYNGNRIVSQKWITQSTSPKVTVNGNEKYGYLWWLREDLGGIIEAQGRGGQRLNILPKEDLVLVMFGTGFDPGDIGGFVVKSMENESQKESTKEDMAFLNAQLSQIKQENETEASGSLPEIAKAISGKRFEFEPNELGFIHFSILLGDLENGFFELAIREKSASEHDVRKVPFGLQGRYIRSNQTRFKTPMAAKGRWLDDSTLTIDYNEFSNAHKYEIVIEFTNEQAVFSIRDEADYGGPITLKAQLNKE